ncbi:MAG: YceI family protein [Hyphomicrobiaceae bacterium]
MTCTYCAYSLRALSAAVFVGYVAAAARPALADRWVFDRDHTEIGFSWDHLGLSRKSGRVLDFEGQIDFTPTDPEAGSIEVTIRAASLWTGVRLLDEHLKSADFFNVAVHPEIRFKSTEVRRTSDKTGEVSGDLTMLGITKPVTLEVTWRFTGEHPLSAVNPNYKGKWVSGFSAETTVLRSAWGLSRAIPLVGDEIGISIEAELLRAK